MIWLIDLIMVRRVCREGEALGNDVLVTSHPFHGHAMSTEYETWTHNENALKTVLSVKQIHNVKLYNNNGYCGLKHFNDLYE